MRIQEKFQKEQTDRRTETQIPQTDKLTNQRLSVTMVSIPFGFKTRASSPNRFWINKKRIRREKYKADEIRERK